MFKRFSVALCSAAALVLVASILTADSGHRNRVRMRDDCDPATFNQAVGDGTCIGNGDTTFAEFIAEVTEDQSAHHWRFNPDDLDVANNATVSAINRGGEVHSFTEVKSFGGGVVPLLNDLSGNPIPAAECLDPASGPSFTPPGGAFTTKALAAGTHLFQCCIHPWMRTEVQAGRKNKDRH